MYLGSPILAASRAPILVSTKGDSSSRSRAPTPYPDMYLGSPTLSGPGALIPS
jgi:hypothetical protein